MSERKVLNKYYPPNYDPTKIPKGKRCKNRIFEIRIMAPFNMKCNTCGTIIPKAKKFNSRKENVEDKTYLGLLLFRFYIRCPQCLSEIAFRTDLEHGDYEMEAGAKRCYEATRLAWIAEKDKLEKEALENENNPMAMVENRMKQSKQEMEIMENIEELKERSCQNSNLTADDLLDMIEIPETQNTQIDEETELIKELGEIRNNVVRLRSNSESSKDSNLDEPIQTDTLRSKKKVPSYFQGIMKKRKTDSSINENSTKQSLVEAYSDSD